MWKWLIGIFLACALGIGVGGYALWKSGVLPEALKQVRPGEKPAEVKLEKVVRGDLVRTVTAPGGVEPRTSVKISAQISARILALPFRENQMVKKGDVLVRLDAETLAARLEAARANLRGEEARLEGSQASLTRTRSELERMRKLVTTGDVAKTALEDAESEYLRAQSGVASATHAIEAARAEILRVQKDIDNTIITSPIDGVITRLDAEVGETVVVGTINSAGSVIMEIADLADMLLKARVDESNVGPVAAGQNARIYINAYPGRVFEGLVERVELQRKVDARDQTGYFEVDIPIKLKPGETLLSGLTANVEIEVETIKDTVVIPSQAVVDRRIDELPTEVTSDNPRVDKNKAFARVVFRVVEDTAAEPTKDGRKPVKTVATPVAIGSSDLTRTVILAGLGEGETIVTGPFKEIAKLQHGKQVVGEGEKKDKDGKPITPTAPPTAAAAPAANGRS